MRSSRGKNFIKSLNRASAGGHKLNPSRSSDQKAIHHRSLGSYLRQAARAIVRTLRTRLSLRFFLADVSVVVISRDPVLFGSTKNAAATAGTTLNIVAHEDDDLLFLNPDLL